LLLSPASMLSVCSSAAEQSTMNIWSAAVSADSVACQSGRSVSQLSSEYVGSLLVVGGGRAARAAGLRRFRDRPDRGRTAQRVLLYL